MDEKVVKLGKIMCHWKWLVEMIEIDFLEKISMGIQKFVTFRNNVQF